MNQNRRYALIICLIHQAQRRAKHALAIMFNRTMEKMHKKANHKFELLKKQHEEMTKRLLNVFHDVLITCKKEESMENIGENILKKISENGGVETLHGECA